MKNTWLGRVLCLVAVMGLFVACGCQMSNAMSPERQRRRMHVIRTDLDHLVNEVDWFLGLDKPSQLVDEEFPY